MINFLIKQRYVFVIFLLAGLILSANKNNAQTNYSYKPLTPPVSYSQADKKADTLLNKMSLDEKIQLIGGYNFYYIKGFEKYNIPELYLSDATQGVHIRKNLNNQLEKSVAFPCPLALAATWNTELANSYAKAIGEECRAGGIAVLLGPAMNIYRISQCGRNFEYFGEDPFLAARMIENYVTGVQSAGTIATLKHFLCNNTEYYRRKSNSIVDERAIHEIYTPAFKAGIDAGAMAVMTSYNQVNGEYAAQSKYVITDLLRNDLGFNWLVMSDWWSTWDPVQTMASGLDLEMPGEAGNSMGSLKKWGDIFVKSSAKKLLNEGKVTEADINRMAKNILKTEIAMGLLYRPVKDDHYLQKFQDHERIALQTARESIVLLRNDDDLLPISPAKKIKILLTGDYVEKQAKGGGSADVEGYKRISMLDALKNIYGSNINYSQNPTEDELKSADVVLLSIGTDDSEGKDKSFDLPKETEDKILNIADKNSNVVVIVNSGGGINMSNWYKKVSAIIYAWYPGQNGNVALAEIISGIANPSGKLPITIEKKFEDSPGYPYLTEGEKLFTGWVDDIDISIPIKNITYKEGVFVGYRWYEYKDITPLYPFGYGLSYTDYDYSDIKLSKQKFHLDDTIRVELKIKNSGKVAGSEIVQLYILDAEASVPRPIKELKGFKKVFLKPGETAQVEFYLSAKDFSYWDINKKEWYAEPGEFKIMVGASSDDIKETSSIILE